MRGYPLSTFITRTAANLNLEYSFPIKELYHGPNYLPLFFKKITGKVFIDGISLEGVYTNSITKSLSLAELKDSFWSTGFEAHLTTSVGYHLPIDWIFGIHYGFTKEAYGREATPFIGIGLSGIDGLTGVK